MTTVKLLIWNNYFTDVTLAVEDGKQFEAHKVILATNLDLLHSSPFYNSRGSWWWWWTITSDDDGEWGILSLVKSIWRSKWKGRAHPDKVAKVVILLVLPCKSRAWNQSKSIWSEWTFKVAAVLHCITNEFKELLAELTLLFAKSVDWSRSSTPLKWRQARTIWRRSWCSTRSQSWRSRWQRCWAGCGEPGSHAAVQTWHNFLASYRGAMRLWELNVHKVSSHSLWSKKI